MAKAKKEVEAVTKVTYQQSGPIVTSPNCKNCKHEKSTHYGSTDNWCNTRDCKCLKFEV